MAKHKYVLVGPEAGAANVLVTKTLFDYEGDALKIEDGFVTIRDNEAENFIAAVIRLAEGQSIKQVK
jgi:hypothetical protein